MEYSFGFARNFVQQQFYPHKTGITYVIIL